MFDRLESTSFFTQKGEQRELLIESDNTDNITFYFDHVEKKPSRIEFKKGENTLSISSRMIRVSVKNKEMAGCVFSLVLDSSIALYEKAQQIEKEING